jgi:Helix-turn-helix domain of resolvase
MGALAGTTQGKVALWIFASLGNCWLARTLLSVLGIQRQEPSLTKEQVMEIRRRAKAGEQKTVLALEFKVSRQTLYTALA